MNPRETRQKLLWERLQTFAYREAIAGAARQLAELLDSPVSVDQALPQDAVDAARDAYLRQERFHLVWVWWDPERKPVRATPVAFRLKPATVLSELPRHLGPPPGDVGPGGAGSDLLLATADGSSGVHLDYQHHADRDEYEMLVWGAFARPILL